MCHKSRGDGPRRTTRGGGSKNAIFKASLLYRTVGRIIPLWATMKEQDSRVRLEPNATKRRAKSLRGTPPALESSKQEHIRDIERGKIGWAALRGRESGNTGNHNRSTGKCTIPRPKHNPERTPRGRYQAKTMQEGRETESYDTHFAPVRYHHGKMVR